MTLWKITGQSSSDSSGGPTEVYAITVDDADVPDALIALEKASDGHDAWFQIDAISRIGAIPTAWFSGMRPGRDSAADVMAGLADEMRQDARRR